MNKIINLLNSLHLKYINEMNPYTIYIEADNYVIIKDIIVSNCNNLMYIGFDKSNTKVIKNFKNYYYTNSYYNGSIFNTLETIIESMNSKLLIDGLYIRQFDEQSDIYAPWKGGSPTSDFSKIVSSTFIQEKKTYISPLDNKPKVGFYSSSIGGYIIDTSNIYINCSCPTDCGSDQSDIYKCKVPGCKFNYKYSPPNYKLTDCSGSDPNFAAYYNIKDMLPYWKPPIELNDSSNCLFNWPPSYAPLYPNKGQPIKPKKYYGCNCAGWSDWSTIVDRNWCTYNEVVLNANSYNKNINTHLKAFFYMTNCNYTKPHVNYISVNNDTSSIPITQPDLSLITDMYNAANSVNKVPLIAWNCKTNKFQKAIIDDPSAAKQGHCWQKRSCIGIGPTPPSPVPTPASGILKNFSPNYFYNVYNKNGAKCMSNNCLGSLGLTLSACAFKCNNNPVCSGFVYGRKYPSSSDKCISYSSSQYSCGLRSGPIITSSGDILACSPTQLDKNPPCSKCSTYGLFDTYIKLDASNNSYYSVYDIEKTEPNNSVKI